MPQYENDALSAGVHPGGLLNREQIRLLLCFLARERDGLLESAQAEELCAAEGLANYFECRAALDELLAGGKLRLAAAGGRAVLRLAEGLGHSVGVLGGDLPRTVCAQALAAADRICLRDQRIRDNHLAVSPLPGGGYHVSFRQGEGDDTLLSVTVFCAGLAHAEAVKHRFLENPEAVYGAILAALE
ncbi:MAG: DUF4364 family protein [Oscillospiraceae bacterium]|jgi:hypothetical protein|nr:DUF4364 family protein [Oscillospiraceae bacterium]